VNVYDDWDGENIELKRKRTPSFVYRGDPHLLT
jgi:hypothetical protein